MQSYYRYLNKANQVAFDASSSHVDVSRFQALTQLSEDNLKYHQDLMNRIEEKVKSGVTRQSDLEQARSRYTLALGNLATEKANTFSAMANYQRITDTVWPVNQAGEYVVNANFEVENRERLVFALNNHPLLKAANAQISGAKQEVTAASEGFQQVAAFGDPAEVSKSLIDKTKSWAKAWENKDVNSYIAFYAPNFKPEEGSYEAWETNRRERISKAQQIDIEISEMQVVPSFDKPDEYEISFVQDYRAKFYQERSRKVLTWRENKGVWQIIREQNLPMNTVNAPNKKNLNLAEAPSAL